MDERSRYSGEGFEVRRSSEPDGVILRVKYWSPELEEALKTDPIESVIIERSWTDEAGAGISFLGLVAERIRSLTISTSALTDLSVVSELRNLESFTASSPVDGVDFSRLPRLRDCLLAHPAGLGNVHECPALEELALFEMPIRDLTALRPLERLRRLYLNSLHRLGTLDGIQSLRLEELNLVYLRKLHSIAPVAELENLRALEIVSAKRVTDIERLGDVGTLQKIRMAAGPPLASLEFLGRLPNLRSLWASASGPVSVAPLTRLRRLQVLQLFDVDRAVDIERLGDLTTLRELVINRGPDLPSLDFLRGLDQLRQLALIRTKIVDGDLGVLLELPSLERASISPHREHHSHTPEELDAALEARHPDRRPDPAEEGGRQLEEIVDRMAHKSSSEEDVAFLDALGAQFESKDAMFEAAKEAVEPLVKLKETKGSFEEVVMLAGRDVRVGGTVKRGKVVVSSIGRPFTNS